MFVFYDLRNSVPQEISWWISMDSRNIIQNLEFLKSNTVFYMSQRLFLSWSWQKQKTENCSLVGSVLLLFSPWFGFYSHHLSVARLKASLVSKGTDERRMTWLRSLPKHALWDTNQGMSVREKTTCGGVGNVSRVSLFHPIFILPLVSAVMWRQPAVCLTACVCAVLCVCVWAELGVLLLSVLLLPAVLLFFSFYL